MNCRATRASLDGETAIPLTRHGYTFDALDRRVKSTLLDGSTWHWGRNGRGEITSAIRKLPDATAVPALGATYDFDDIGNRKTATSPILGDFDYIPNAVNQYTAIATNATRTVLGTAPVASNITVNSASADRLGNLFSAALTGNNADDPVWLTASVTDGATTQARHTWLPAATTSLQHDYYGNLTHDGQWTYLWDAENRLVEMETTPAAVQAGRPYRKLTFAYDWTGRRLARDIYGPNNTLLNATRWLYDGWNPVAEFSDQTTGQTLVRAYLWGMDLSGTMQGAGGVGGLLSVFEISNSQISNRHFPSYDSNGNIVAWTQSGATVPACLREYDSFGNILIEHGTPPCAIGFSTKIEDPETGLLYYGYRYLSPPLGRWLSQDPIEEQGGLNLYGFVRNDGILRMDAFGLVEYKQLPNAENKGKEGTTSVLGRLTFQTILEGEQCCVRLSKIEWWCEITYPTDDTLRKAGFVTDPARLNEFLKKYPSLAEWYLAYRNGNPVGEILKTQASVLAHERKHADQYTEVAADSLSDAAAHFKKADERCFSTHEKAEFWRKGRNRTVPLGEFFNPHVAKKYPGREGLPPGEAEAVEAEIATLRQVADTDRDKKN